MNSKLTSFGLDLKVTKFSLFSGEYFLGTMSNFPPLFFLVTLLELEFWRPCYQHKFKYLKKNIERTKHFNPSEFVIVVNGKTLPYKNKGWLTSNIFFGVHILNGKFEKHTINIEVIE